jgi:hypothetical protein
LSDWIRSLGEVKILVATSLTQGTSPKDYHYCVEGELVWMQDACDRESCGCSRGFAGAASHRATTTAKVVESEMTRADVELAFRTSLADGGWPAEWAPDVTDDNLELAAQLPVGSIITRSYESYRLRGALF